MSINADRTNSFQKDLQLETVLAEVNDLISTVEISSLTLPKLPIVLIMGCARSGSTLLYQYLASCGLFCFPSNLVARFPSNPYLGMKIQQALTGLFDKDSKRKKEDFFQSNLGQTSGALAPSEFWYFWRNHFDFSNGYPLGELQKKKVKTDQFLKQLAAFELITNQPLLMKGMIMNWDIELLHAMYPNFIFINLQRDLLSNAQSLLTARKTYFNDQSKWYSFKPPEYLSLKNFAPIAQVVGQVYYTQLAIAKGMAMLPAENKITISYNEFCKHPIDLVNLIRDRALKMGTRLDPPISTVSNFEPKRKEVTFTDSEINEFKQAIQKYD